MKTFLIIPACLVLLSCAATEESEKGYWVNDKPFRGTIPANRNNKNPYWQCVGNNQSNILDCKK